MRKFKEVFGYYPKTVGAWVIDTHTLNYLSKHYDISAVAICRDQANTDAYTMLGGYFNQAYYPSKNNIFTPAQSKEMQTSVPVFRLLGPCPIHNYDNNKYSSDALRALGRKSACFTLEPGWYMGSTPDVVRWMFDSYYGEESLGFAYAQIGQENSFLKVKDQVLEGTRCQIEMLLEKGDVSFQKMGTRARRSKGCIEIKRRQRLLLRSITLIAPTCNRYITIVKTTRQIFSDSRTEYSSEVFIFLTNV
jgi:hypothetical protein